MNPNLFLRSIAILLLPSFVFLSGCGSSRSVSNNSSTGTGAVANSVAVVVDSGPPSTGFANLPYVTVSVCQPGTSNCAAIDHVLVDTGSAGLRLVSSVLPSGFTLPAAKSGSASLYECLPFLDSYTWGTVVTADLEMAGEKAPSLPVQIISTASAPTTCSSTVATSGSPQVSSVADLGANGILGVGNFGPDCGSYCAQSPVQSQDLYFACTSTTASSCSQAAVPVANQVANPVGFFANDNNGVVIQMASVPAGGAATATGTMYFGIGTQSDNTPPSGVTVLGLDNSADFGTTFQSKSYPNSFADTGSNALFFGTIDSTLKTSTGIPGCNLGTTANPFYFYCPASELSESATITSGGTNTTTSKAVSFNVGNVNNLTGFAMSDLAGPNTVGAPDAGTSFDWGMPFFYGRTVYIGLEGKSSSLGSNLYIAF